MGAPEGVKMTRVGYCGGSKERPTYRKVCSDPEYSDWAECVQVDFDEEEISFAELCEVFFEAHEPSVRETKRQYMSFIFAHTDEQFEAANKVLHGGSFRRSVSTGVEMATDFYEAELYHQKWMLQKSPWFKRLGLQDPRDLVDVQGVAACKLNAFAAGKIEPAYLRWYAASWVEDDVVSQKTFDRLKLYLDRL